MKRWDAISRTRIVTHIYSFSAYMKPSSRESGYLRQMWEVENNTMKVKPRGYSGICREYFQSAFFDCGDIFFVRKTYGKKGGRQDSVIPG